MFVKDICRRDVDTVSYGESAFDVARRMRERQVGSVIVVDDGRPVGIVTDRDLVMRVLADGRDPRTTRVSDVMTPSPTTIAENETIVTATGCMRQGRFRRLPVVGGDGRVAGVIALDDVIALVAQGLAEVGPLLAREAPHRWLGRQT